MERTKKLGALFLAIIMMISVISGCASDSKKNSEETSVKSQSQSDKETESETKTSEVSALDTSEEVEIVMYVVSDRPAKQDEVDAYYNEILKEKMNTTIKLNWIGWAEYANKYPLLFSSGEKFDMAYTATWLNFASLAQKGAFKNLNELWPEYAPKNYSRQNEMALSQAKVNGDYYCIPTLYATYNAYGPVYRTDILEGTDWDGKMEDFDDYETYLSYVKENAPELEPVDIYQSGSEIDDTYMYFNKLYPIKGSTNDFLWIDPYEEDPQLFTYYEYEGTPDFLARMARWNEKGYFTKSALSDTDSTKMQNNKAASKVYNDGNYVSQHIYNPNNKVKFVNFAKDISYMPFTQDAAVVSNSSENPERALAVYDLITSDEEMHRAFFYGIEGTSYEIIDNQVKMLDTDSYAANSFWAARTTEFTLDNYGAPTDYPDLKASFDKQIDEIAGNGSAKYRGFAIDTTPIETEYAACQNVHQQYWWPLELGYTDAEQGLADYKAKMEAAGIEKVKEFIQSQFDEYKSSIK
ncbi:ABC transporter substrate-binding protein [Scatolibacter rhodanostii]|uniref:ABC transporter substrate-binding protein n=1 Tax=Scatolibacter rhodanostii TaxID=2014781 RepID=UPI000C0889CB|nr:ABC transporter substrate-binding protein [Scatolibacter rhodanostii]